ncbi:hypothetical protein M3Y98_00238700 [Aphelenchoides besseyi]|nr:hypothetical protein M3Y98_00238700 [Aphelenchoides besseyi]KAI6200654.1 hypothetical protein M3Y96_00756800 [Aphelenchoides besseyi]
MWTSNWSSPAVPFDTYTPQAFNSLASFPTNSYSVKFTTIPTFSGQPIGALVLKRRRKRRHRKHALQTQNSSEDHSNLRNFVTPIASTPSTRSPKFWNSIADVCSSSKMSTERATSANGNADVNCGSCPDLHQQFDEIGFKAIENERDDLEHEDYFSVKNRRRTTTNSEMLTANNRENRSDTQMRTSIYEICAPVEFESVDQCDLNGNNHETEAISSTVPNPMSELVTKEVDQENDRSPASSNDSDSGTTATQRLAEKLRRELEDLQFRHSHEWQRADGSVMKIKANPLFETEYYPQHDQFTPSHLTTYDSTQNSFVTNSLRLNEQNNREPDYHSFESDYFEGMSIRVNPFEEDNDMVLAEADCPPVSKIQQLAWAIQRQKERYNDQIQTSQRTCCSLM